MRLQKYMAASGVASRRKSEEIITQGRVTVNGKIVDILGSKVEKGDVVKVDGKRIRPVREHTYILLHKPLGVVSTADDEKDRTTVVDLVDTDARIYPVGRLDMDSTGLVFLTDDGAVTQKIMHPGGEIKKTYIVTVEGTPDGKALEKLRRGVFIQGGKTAPADVRILRSYPTDSILKMTIHEGRNHQIKNMCEAVGHPVKKLKRISIGELELGGLEPGEWRKCDTRELKYLRSLK